ncbi:MAG: hypothetical protein HUK20_04540 [Fibrobacter sp.]|nr:hypothetical protein [Fibrobacter sp.]
MRRAVFYSITCFCLTAVLSQAQQALPAKTANGLKKAQQETQEIDEAPWPLAEDTVYVEIQDGIPWNRENFPRERLIRRYPSFDEALKVGYTYTLSFVGGSFGTFAHQSYMAHLAYEFTPNLHLYADLGIWMPLYVNWHENAPMAREDIRTGQVGFLLPDIALEYRPSETSYLRLQFVNERDARKAYGPLNYRELYCNPYRNSIFCR